KERHLFALKKGGELKALIMANVSDIGLNMSNLTSCATVIVLDEALPRSVLESALSTVAAKYGQDDVPVLVYPVSYAERESLPSEKMYSLWVLNLHYLDHYFKFCDALFHADKKSS
ncbi:MAG TPA: pilus assembly protein PilZ, partial [Geobacteraceae bacterium]|nr:pilus assembly protein PilZ [Geobacteraceae bacterium]